MQDLQVNVYVCIGITWFAALAALVMRVIARRMTRIEWWFDDYFCVFAFVSSIFPLYDYMLMSIAM
jgi:hypothetical protein